VADRCRGHPEITGEPRMMFTGVGPLPSFHGYGLLRPEPRARTSPTGVGQVREALREPTARRRATPRLYFAAVLLTRARVSASS